MSRFRCLLLVLALLTSGIVSAQAPTFKITPRDRLITASNREVAITVDICQPWGGVYWQNPVFKLNGAAVSGWTESASPDDGSVCEYARRYDKTLTLATNTRNQPFDVRVFDAGNAPYDAPTTYYAIPWPARGVLVSSAAAFPTVPTNTDRTEVFTIWNTGDVNTTYSLSVACGGAVSVVAPSCTLSRNSVTVNALSSDTVTAFYHTPTTAGAAGSITVTANDDEDDGENVSGSAWSEPTSKDPPGAGFVVWESEGVNMRDACVAASISSNVAMECGDLRVTHAMPAVTTFGKARAPTLLYNSATANPQPVVQVDITYDTPPDSVVVWVDKDNRTLGTSRYAGSDWSSNSTRRVAVKTDASSLATYMYYANVWVQTWRGGSPSASYQTIRYPVVNRSTTPYGAGWWIAGLEEVYRGPWSNLLWVGGDGSNRYYSPAGTRVWKTVDKFDAPDSITANTDTTEFIRWGPGKLQVKFDGLGRHTATVNRLGQTTTFGYASGTRRLTDIYMPVVQYWALGYGIVYDSNNLIQRFFTPSDTGSRWTEITTNAGRITEIEDPDGNSVSFAYGSGANANRLETRTNRRGASTSLWFNAANKITQSQVSLEGPTNITSVYRAAESRGHAEAAQPLDSAFTMIDGPRTDVADVTKIWVNRFGAPTRIRNAEGRETRMRYDAVWPGLVSETRTPSTMLSRATYNAAKGNLDTLINFNSVGSGIHDTTSYTYESTWNFVNSVRGPTGVIDSMAYDASTGNRVWAQTGGSSRRVNFYYDSHGLDSAVTLPGSITTRITHNSRGNVASVTSPKGYVTSYYQLVTGEDTLIVSPVDTSNSVQTKVRHTYSKMGRPLVTTTYGQRPSLPLPYDTMTAVADSLRLERIYDAEGNLKITKRQFRAVASNWSLEDTTSYDIAGRVTRVRTPTGSTTHYRDMAGNDTAITNGRGKTVTMQYDALNRLVKRVVPKVTYDSTSCSGLFNWPSGYACGYHFPTIGNSVCFNADTSRFAYDDAGNMIQADNRYAQIRRSYYLNGLLQDDTLRIRSVNEPGDHDCGAGGNDARSGGAEWTAHVYMTHALYTRAGQRSSLTNPYSISSKCGSGPCITTWNWSYTTGLLSSVSDDVTGTTEFTYDNAGRRTDITYPNSVVDHVDLDADGRVHARSVDSLIVDTLFHDATGRTTRAYVKYRDGVEPGATINTWYGPMGAVVLADGVTTPIGGTTKEFFNVDAIGNRWKTEAKNMRPQSHPDVDGVRLLTHNWNGQLTAMVAAGQTSGFTSNKDLYYDGSGNDSLTKRLDFDYATTTNRWDATMSYYDAADKLRVFNRAVGPLANDNSQPGGRNVFEEYFYDALGRRVLMRSRRNSPGVCSTVYQECISIVQRTVWDGDHVLMEIRAPGNTDTTTEAMENDAAIGPSTSGYPYGRVAYVHAGGMDQPISVLRMGMQSQSDTFHVFPHANWRGQYEVGTLHNGTVCRAESCAIAIAWPGAQTMVDGARPAATDDPAWFGSLITGGSDGSGMTYLRNRYYDPGTGRFTQEDPIGLAGGMNLYGFAGGDRINFSDPFGLCPVASGGLQCLFSDLVGGGRSAAKGAAGTAAAAASNVDVYMGGTAGMSSVEGSVSGGGAWALKAGAALSSEVFGGSLGLRVRTGAPSSAADITGSFEVFSTPIGGISITGSNNGNAWTSFGVQLGGGVTRTGTHSRVNVQQAIPGAEACFGSACKPPGK